MQTDALKGDAGKLAIARDPDATCLSDASVGVLTYKMACSDEKKRPRAGGRLLGRARQAGFEGDFGFFGTDATPKLTHY